MEQSTLIKCCDNILCGFIHILCIILCCFTSSTMKGDKNRKKTKSGAGYFKTGHKKPGPGRPVHQPNDSDYIRPSSEEATLLDVDPIMHDAMKLEEPNQHTMLLRPRQKCPKTTNYEESRSDSDCYRVFHVGKLMQMINEVNSDHARMFPKCQSHLALDTSSEDQRGIVWRERMICLRPKCSFRSKMYNLYTEIEQKKRQPGRKTATANMGINIAMTQTSIGPSSLVKILAGANIDGPSIRGLTKSSRATSEIIVNENKSDMSERIQRLRAVNKWQGRPEGQIPVQMDGLYNNNLYSGVGRTPFQPATQCTLTVAENITKKKQIVAVETVNKLCAKHGFHTQDEDPCDVMAGPCTATASMETNIGDEERWAKTCLEQLSRDGMEVKYVTTDGDGKSFEAARQLNIEGKTKTKPIHQLDTRHLGANHRKFVKSSNKVTAMMPGRTKAYRMYLQNRFALDLSQRCQAELKHVISKCRGQINILQYTRDLITVIKQCYSGNHSLCRLKSHVCKGKLLDNWIQKSIFLPNVFKINISKEENESTLMDCIQYRLGDDTVQLTKLNTNTQKVEATNKAIKACLPKDKTFPTMFEARAHSAIHRANNGPGQSLRKLCQAAGCPIPYRGRVERRLQALQRDTEIKKKKAQSVAYKMARKIRKQRLFRLYEHQREEKKYIKNQLTRALNRARRAADKPQPSTSTQTDHDTYTRSPTQSKKRKQSTTSNKNTGGDMTKAGGSTKALRPPTVIIVRLKNQVSVSYAQLVVTKMTNVKTVAIIVCLGKGLTEF